MSLREKTAWLTLTAMVIAYGVYFTWVSQAGEQRLLDLVWWFGGVTILQAVVVIIGSIVAAKTSDQANAPADERDRAIARRGTGSAYYVLMVGTIVVGVVMPFSYPAWKIINAALLVLVVAEAIRHIVIVLSYRRGWHG